MPARTLTRVAILAALAFALMFLGEIPIPYLTGAKFDLSEIPAVLAALGLGPLAGLAVEVLKDVLFLASGKAASGWVGVAANLTAGATLVLVTGLVAQFLGLRWEVEPRPERAYWLRGAAAVATGAVAMALVMLVANAHVFIPLFLKQPGPHWGLSAAWVPFNLIKGALAGSLALALHRRVAPSVLSALTRAA